MSFRIVHALWDDKDTRVALLLNPDDQFSRWRTRYEVYLTVGGHRDFVGVFDATRPAARDWPDLPPWIVLPLPKGAAAFSLELQPQKAAAAASPIRLDFDSTVIFDYRRRGVLDEERFYCWHAESAGGRPGAFERRHHLFVRGQEMEGDNLIEGDFVNSFVDVAARHRHRVTRMLAYTVREGRIGPAKEILGANARREVPVKAEFEQHRFPTLAELQDLAVNAGQETESIDTKAFRSIIVETEAYEQPRLSLRLGSSERGARSLQGRITFLHIPTNQISALRAIQTRHPPGSPEEARTDWVNRILGLSSIAGTRDPLDLLFDERNGFVRHGSELPLLAERRGETQIYYLDNTFDRVAMGDIVGIFVHDNVRLDYPSRSQRTESGEDAETKSSFSSLYLRFLIDRLEPMDTERVILEYSEEIGDVLNRVKRQLMARPSDPDGDPVSQPPTDGISPASRNGNARGLGLTELFAPALENVLIDEDRRRPRGKPGRLREVMTPADFHRLPNVAHALCVTEHFASRVKEVGRRPPEAEPGFCAAALHMVGGTERARGWLKLSPGAVQQAIIWQMFEIEPDFVDDCARLQVVIPGDYRPDPDVLRELYALLRQPQKLDRAARIFMELGRADYARKIMAATEALGSTPTAATPVLPSLQDLEANVGFISFADRLLREESERASAILTACKLPAEPFDIAALPVSGEIDHATLGQLKARATEVLQRKLAPGQRETLIGDLQRMHSVGVLHLLADRLELVDHRSEILGIVLGTVDAMTQWANQTSDQIVASGRQLTYAPLTETEWDQIRSSLRAMDLLPEALQIRRLAAGQDDGLGGATLAPVLRQRAQQLAQLIEGAQQHAGEKLGAAAGRATGELHDQFATLERFAGVALATLTASQLTAAATRIGEYLAGVQATSGSELLTLAESWNALGRALAPDRALHMLPEALRQAERLFQHAGKLIDPGNVGAGIVELPPPPTYDEVRRALAA